MPTLERFIDIEATKENLFELSQNYSLRLQWDPYLRVAKVENQSMPGVGVQVYCESKKGVGMWVEYITYKYPDYTAMKMTKGPFIFRQFAGSWRFEALNTHLTRVKFRYNYECIGGKWGAFFFSPIIKRLLLTDLHVRLKGLKHAVEKTSILQQL